jgi:hypothetical protein
MYGRRVVMQMVGLKRLVLQMPMCCIKCAEIISEKLREVPGEHDCCTSPLLHEELELTNLVMDVLMPAVEGGESVEV